MFVAENRQKNCITMNKWRNGGFFEVSGRCSLEVMIPDQGCGKSQLPQNIVWRVFIS